MNTTARYCTINGNLQPANTGSMSIFDLAVQRGYGIFDFFKVIRQQPVFVEDHLDRFFHSAAQMRLDPGLSREALKAQIAELIGANDLPESGIRLTLTGGDSPDGYSIGRPNLLITETPLILPREMPAGIRLMTFPYQRQLPQVKTIDYLMAIWLQPRLKELQVQDVLYIGDGYVRECPRANFFIINKDGALQTSREKLLQGITRKKVLELASGLLPVLEQDISMEDLRLAKEAFITSTTKHITPVLRIDDIDLTIGKNTQGLSDRYLQLLQGLNQAVAR